MQQIDFRHECPFRYPERELCVNSARPYNQRVREFCQKSSSRQGYDRDPEPDARGTERVRTELRISQTARKTGENEKTPRGTLSAFSVNWMGSESSLTDFSSPKGTLFVTMRAFSREAELTQHITGECFGDFRVSFGRLHQGSDQSRTFQDGVNSRNRKAVNWWVGFPQTIPNRTAG